MKSVVELAEERKEFIQLEDGFWYWWPSVKGAVPSHQLLAIAEELDRRNAPWEREIEKYFENN